MPKALVLTPDMMSAPQIVPRAATPARSSSAVAEVPRRSVEAEVAAPKADQVPLQIRIPREEARAIKVAAAERDMSISDFMLACFHARMRKPE